MADTVTGPYKFVDVAVPTWSHNAAPIALHDGDGEGAGTFAIVHIGGGNGAADGGRNCTCEKIPGGCPPPPPPPPCPAGSDIPGYRCFTAACAAKSVIRTIISGIWVATILPRVTAMIVRTGLRGRPL